MSWWTWLLVGFGAGWLFDYVLTVVLPYPDTRRILSDEKEPNR